MKRHLEAWVASTSVRVIYIYKAMAAGHQVAAFSELLPLFHWMLRKYCVGNGEERPLPHSKCEGTVDAGPKVQRTGLERMH